MMSFRKPEPTPIEIRPVVKQEEPPVTPLPFAGVWRAARTHPWVTWLVGSVFAIVLGSVYSTIAFSGLGLVSVGLMPIVWIVVQLVRGAKLLKKASEK